MKEKGAFDALSGCKNSDLSKILSMYHSGSNASSKPVLPANGKTKTVYSQGKTGLCWLSSALLCISLFLKKRDGIELTEENAFSKSYLFYWDKIERTELFLSLIDQNIADEQKMRFILNHLVTDRGQWNMAENLILKYGVVPYKAMPDPFVQVSSADLNASINNLLRLYAFNLRKGIGETEKVKMKKRIMDTVRTMLTQLTGDPPAETDVPEVFKCREKLSPQAFFHKYIRFPFEDHLLICNFAPESNSFYEVTLDNNMINGIPELLLNLSNEDFNSAVSKQLKKNGFCWYTCDASKGFCPEEKAFDDPNSYGIFSGISSYDMVRNRLSSPNHAMVLTYDDQYFKDGWLLSHNSKSGFGYGMYIPVSKAWVEKYVFQAVVHKSCIASDCRNMPRRQIMPFELFFIN